MGRRSGLSLLAILFIIRAQALTVLVSHAEFRSVEENKVGSTYTEAYWQIIPTGLHFTNQEGKWRTQLKADIQFRNEAGSIVAEEQINVRTAPANSMAEAMRQNIFDLHRYKLPEGKITMQLSIAEQGYASNVFNYTDSFIVEGINSLFYSSVQLLDTSYESAQANVYAKNGRMTIPLATNFLDNYHRTLHFYTELYQTDMLADSSYPLVQRTFISKREFEPPLGGLMQKQSISKHTVVPHYGDFSITTLRSGNYYLNVVLEDKKGSRLAARSYFFQRENKNPEEVKVEAKKDTTVEKVELIDVSKTFVMKFTMPQLMAVLKMISPISDALEIQTIRGFQKRPDEMYIRYFIYNFWVARNKTNPQTEWEKYADKIREVNRLFTAGAIRGYETERGHTYLKYGPPDERVPVENESGALPYEIWEYRNLGKLNQEGVFLFYRPKQMINDYMLLHSTLNGEVRNMNWRNTLYINGAATNPNSRAEQYIRNR